MKYLFRRIAGAFLLILFLIVGFNVWIILGSWDEVIDPEYENYDTGILLGASVKADGTLSPVLQQRVDAAIQAYEEGIIKNILVSGYDKNENHLEALSMEQYLLDAGVDKDDISSDPNGYDTLASMQRASKFYDIDRAIIFTQRYHLRRSIALAKSTGMDAVGYAVDENSFSWSDFGTSREFLARIKAFFEIYIAEG